MRVQRDKFNPIISLNRIKWTKKTLKNDKEKSFLQIINIIDVDYVIRVSSYLTDFHRTFIDSTRKSSCLENILIRFNF